MSLIFSGKEIIVALLKTTLFLLELFIILFISLFLFMKFGGEIYILDLIEKIKIYF
ncbi:MAG: hypothetical protein ACRDD2_13560 [Sarcina sp.]